jgi:predicted small integral membrane protein
VEAWNEAGGSAWGKAKAIFSFLKDSYSLGFFWKIIKLIVQNMTTWEKIRAIAPNSPIVALLRFLCR